MLLVLVRLEAIGGALVAQEGAEVAVLVAVVRRGEHGDHQRIDAVLLAEPMLLVAVLHHLVCAHDEQELVVAHKL